VWSADSRRLYFVSNRHGTSDVYAVTIDERGGPRGQPTRLTTGLGVYSVALSTDRKRLAYAQTVARANLWSLPIPRGGPVVDIAGARPLTSGNQVIESMRVSPDRQWILYDSNVRGNSDIFRLPIAGGQPEQLTDHAADDFAPVVSADGRWLAFHSWRTKTRDVFVRPLGGGPVHQITASEGQESYPEWMPDGSLAFIDQAFDKSGVFRGTLLAARTQDGWAEPRVWLPRVAGLKHLADGRVVYSLDTLIRVGRAGQDGEVIYRPQPPQLPYASQLAVGDDGKTVYFKGHDADGRAAFWVLPLDGSGPRMLVRFPDLARPSGRPDFTVGDGRFFFTIDERRSNVWLADVTER
jgi:hypothetical protein